MGKRSCSVGECFLGLDSWLTEKLDETMPDVVIFEAPIFFGRGDVMIVQRLMGLAAITELIALKRGLRVYRAEGSTVTKAFTGRGRFPGGREEKKRATIETCRHYGWSPTDDNQADALALLHYAQSILSHGAVERSAGPLFAGDAPQTRIGRRPGVA
jgi:Holliday junction resolvasome RuvABC endonuclease subunit